MKVIAVIPARYAATRFPAKLMGMLGDKTVIRTTYENTLKTNLFDDVFVVTDSEIIHNEITRNGGKALMSQREHETGSDRIAEAVEHLDSDIIINVQGDEPFVQKEPLEKLISALKEDKEQKIDLATLMQELKEEKQIQDTNYVKVVCDINNFALYFSRAPIPFARETNFRARYFEHIGIYAFRKESLINFSKLEMLPNEKAEKIECIRYLEYGMKIKMIETQYMGIEIDTAEDLEKANEYLKKLLSI